MKHTVFLLSYCCLLCLTLSCKTNQDAGEEEYEITVGQDRNWIPESNSLAVGQIDFQLKNSTQPQTPDAQSAYTTFKQLVDDHYFQVLQHKTIQRIERNKFPILIGDLNGDNIEDVLLPYTIFGQSKEDSFFLYYLVFLNDGESLIPVENFFAGSRDAELYFRFDKITDSGTVVGKQIPGVINKYPDQFPAHYYFDGKELISMPKNKPWILEEF